MRYPYLQVDDPMKQRSVSDNSPNGMAEERELTDVYQCDFKYMGVGFCVVHHFCNMIASNWLLLSTFALAVQGATVWSGNFNSYSTASAFDNCECRASPSCYPLMACTQGPGPMKQANTNGRDMFILGSCLATDVFDSIFMASSQLQII